MLKTVVKSILSYLLVASATFVLIAGFGLIFGIGFNLSCLLMGA